MGKRKGEKRKGKRREKRRKERKKKESSLNVEGGYRKLPRAPEVPESSGRLLKFSWRPRECSQKLQEPRGDSGKIRRLLKAPKGYWAASILA